VYRQLFILLVPSIHNICMVSHWTNILTIFSLLYRACCQVTQLFYQPLHLYEFIKFTPLNTKNAPTCISAVVGKMSNLTIP